MTWFLSETSTPNHLNVGLERKIYHRCDIKGYFLVSDVADNTTPVSYSVATTSGILYNNAFK